MAIEVKTIGSSGQISLGKQYSGRTVVVDELEAGVWLIKTAQVIPDNERWIHQPEVARALAEGMAWADANPPRESNLDELEAKLKAHHKRRRKAS